MGPDTPIPIGWIGTGALGLPLAQRLLAAGHPLSVWNRTTDKALILGEAGATIVGRIRDLANNEVIFTCVSGEPALQAVLFDDDGLLSDPERIPKVIVDCSRLSVDYGTKLLIQLADMGVSLVAAPVSGSPAELRRGELVIGISGDPSACESVRPIVAHLGRAVLDLGSGAEGWVIKACHNAIMGVTAEVIAESIALAESLGATRARLCAYLAEGMLGSPYVSRVCASFATETPSWTPLPQSSAPSLDDIVTKAQDHGIRAPVLTATRGALTTAVAQGTFLVNWR